MDFLIHAAAILVQGPDPVLGVGQLPLQLPYLALGIRQRPVRLFMESPEFQESIVFLKEHVGATKYQHDKQFLIFKHYNTFYIFKGFW